MTPADFGERIVDDGVFQPSTFPLALSIAAFCNEGIVVLTPSTQSAMKNPDDYAWTAFWGIAYVVLPLTVCWRLCVFLRMRECLCECVRV